MSDSLITIVAIFLAAILMFVFPLMSVAERSDDIAELTAQSAVSEFVDTARETGKITISNYNEMVTSLESTGNTFDIEIEVKVLDENVGKKSSWTTGTVIGENIYYSVYTSQIMNYLSDSDIYGSDEESGAGVYLMKEGDIISCSVQNNNETLAQTIRGIFYSITGSGTYQIAAQSSGLVTANGTY